ncbi:thermonuclease family protein [Bacillus sp. SKDU12]|uniref:thermonuclease family protein n=1 Tax=Bacillus sp. SKDU12 TaxID=1337053 RepID=UPI00138A015D|nr:endonuclease [Bacillus sp. SKDU12]
MKKVLLGFAAFALSLSLAACSSNDAEKANTEKGTPQASKDAERKTGQKKAAKEKTAEKAKKKDQKKLVDVTLNRAVDGDTIKVSYNGKVNTVRYLLVDTPETKKPNSCVQPYGEDASKRNKELVKSGKLQLEFDKGDRRDKYGRLLAYVYVGGKSVQETLLKEGLARVAYVYKPNTKYLDTYKKDEQVAEDKDLKIWSKNGYATDRGFNGCVKKKNTAVKKATISKPATSQPTPPKTSSDASTTNENEASSKSAREVETFKNCTELRKKYPHGVPSSHPAYQSKMDRDHDNYACER